MLKSKLISFISNIRIKSQLNLAKRLFTHKIILSPQVMNPKPFNRIIPTRSFYSKHLFKNFTGNLYL